MRRWEYAYVTENTELELDKRLRVEGREGWELVSVTIDGSWKVAWLKRPDGEVGS